MGFLPSIALPSKGTIKKRCTTLEAWALPKQDSTIAPDYVWTNKDMDPVPIEDQTWSMWTWVAYWATDMINLGTWETASSIIQVGLTWRDAIPIMAVGTLCVAIPVVLNGAIGAHLHAPFSVIVRSGFGYYFAYFAIASRCILAMFWLGIQSANGALAMQVMLMAIWPSFASYDWNGPNNTLPKSGGISTAGMIAYFLFWLIQLSLLLIPPTRLRYLFIIKLIAAPITAFATLGYMIHKAGGTGAIFSQPGTATGETRIYLWLSCMSSVTGVWATLACNIPDFSRYAKGRADGKTNYAQYIQLPVLPIIFTLCGALGVITTSASKVVYGEFYWNPLDIVAQWLNNGSAGRAAAFFAALSWYIAQVGTNITANSISAANDMCVMAPRYINIKRGCVIAAVVSCWVMVPWKILSDAETFLRFMSGYSVFLAPMAGIIAADYWLIKKRHIDVPALYDPHGRYRYVYGINWQGLVAFLIAVCPNLPGLADSINGISISAGAKHLYAFDWLYGFVSSVFVYTVLSMVFPTMEALIPKTIYSLEVVEGKETSPDRDIESESRGIFEEKKGFRGEDTADVGKAL
ncbi:uridine permease-like protein Fui1 [Aureobasidium pullulans]|uniref:Uridine permease-like protein Fui1 n=1 Tax=Aureobasidium pullulans TaxID=5580 RepID=A0A4S9F2U4_AURPU|nr:uridine permease-like protein Fui1 [Aureobasidium pullulans]